MPSGGEQRDAPLVDAVAGHEGAQALGGLDLLAHRDEGVGRERLGAARGLVGVLGERQRAAAGGRDAVARRRRVALVELVGVGRRDDDVAARDHGGADERAADVVGVADVGQAQAAQVGAEALAQRQQVGERLARVMVVGEAVDHGHARELGELVDVGLRVRADHDRVEVAREHHRGVAHGLAAAELQLALRQVERVAAELVPCRPRTTRACASRPCWKIMPSERPVQRACGPRAFCAALSAMPSSSRPSSSARERSRARRKSRPARRAGGSGSGVA